jgi:hypothetical protein
MTDETLEAETTEDRMVWRSDLYKSMGVCSETIRQWIKSKKLPEPDIKISPKRMGWKLSNLHKAGIWLL